MKFYLAHSTIDKDFVKDEIEPKLKKVMEIVNPFDYEHWEVENEKFIKEGNSKTLTRLAIKTVARDLEYIDQSDGIIAYINSPSIGTFMEILYATEAKKKVYLICPSKVHRTHPWLLTFSDGIFKNVDELLEALK